MTRREGIADPPDVDYEFENEDTAPRAARSALTPIVGSGRFADDVKLASSELVTNVVRHTRDGGRMLAWDADPLRLEVHDTSRTMPARRIRPTASGRGLRIVDELSSYWGAERTPNGKKVWAEFDRRSA